MFNFLHKLLSYCCGRNGSALSHAKRLGVTSLVEKNGGRIDVHPSALLNSQQDGYHVGMPFDTTLIADAPGAIITVGEGCRIHGAYIHAWDFIEIGKEVLIAAGTNIVDANGHSEAVRYARYRRYFRDRPKGIKIGDHVWIGMNCSILKGVEIGECSIISAGSVVKDSVPAFCTAEGNPAKIVRRFNSEDALEVGCPLEMLSSEDGFFVY
jgi:acetyltransferase-like isoleucine patch superfamily enzyme